MYHGLGQEPAPEWQQAIRTILAIPELQPLEAKVVNAVQPYVPTVAKGFLAGWWATNRVKVLTAAVVGLGLYVVLRRR